MTFVFFHYSVWSFFPGLLFSENFWMEMKRMLLGIKIINNHKLLESIHTFNAPVFCIHVFMLPPHTPMGKTGQRCRPISFLLSPQFRGFNIVTRVRTLTQVRLCRVGHFSFYELLKFHAHQSFELSMKKFYILEAR